MTHLPPLIQDLAVILITAAITTLLFKRLKQPVVLGYLIAGLLVGPHVTLLPDVVDTKSIHVWAEIGVIFLLFGLGLEFSFKKLASVGKSAGIAALFEIITMTGVGYLLGRALGWKVMDSLFLGTILSMSSTTIIIRAFEELGLKAKGFVSLVFGVLIVEDLAAILILVLLATIASPAPVSGTGIIFSTAKLGFFLLLWFLVGIYFVPALLKRVKSLLSDETMLVVSIGLCLMMVLLATKVGFSPALGAFVMGSILAETREGKRIEHLMLPVRDLFAAVFFVSVGMMIDPSVLQENFWVVLLIIVVTIVGKLFGSSFGAILSGRSFKQSMQAGLSLAQIGEFSFLIATLGMTLKVTSDFLYPIVIAVSAVTTFTTPYMIKYSDPICSWIERWLPTALKERLARYEAAMASESNNVFILLWREYGLKVILNTVVVIALTLLISRAAMPEIVDALGDSPLVRLASCIIALAICAPFIGAIVLGRPKDKFRRPEEVETLKRLHFGVLLVRMALGIVLVGSIIAQFTNVQAFSGIALVILGTIVVLFGRYAEPLYQAVEKRFLANLNDKETAELEHAGPTRPPLAPWDATLAEFVVSPNSALIAKKLEESALKETTGATIAMIERGNRKITVPKRTDMLLPYDRVYIIGTDEQLALAQAKIETEVSIIEENNNTESFGLESVILEEGSPYILKTIRSCGLREDIHGLIVGIERDDNRILNPRSDLTLQLHDRIWVVGDRSRIKTLKGKS